MVLWNFDLPWKIFGTMEKKLWTMEKTMVLWKNYDHISKTMELSFTMEKTLALWKQL